MYEICEKIIFYVSKLKFSKFQKLEISNVLRFQFKKIEYF